MDNNFSELINELFTSNYKSNNYKLQLVLNYLDNINDVNEYIFEIVDLVIYCLRKDKLVEAKKLINIINLNQVVTFNSLLKSFKKYSDHTLYNLTYNTKLIADYFFKFIKRFKFNTFKLLSVLSFNKNGYIRQNALIELSQFNYTNVLPYFLFRINDCIDEISNYALSYILTGLNLNNDEIILNHFFMFNKLRYAKRQKTNINHLLIDFNQILSKIDIFKIKYAYEKEKQIECKISWLNYLINRDDPMVTNFLKNSYENNQELSDKIINYLKQKLSVDDFNLYLKNSKHPFHLITYIQLTEEIEKIKPYLYHQSINVQRRAREKLKSIGYNISIREYLKELNIGVYKNRNIIYGLIDICTVNDIEILWQYLNYKYNYPKKWAIKKLCSLKKLKLEDLEVLSGTILYEYAHKNIIKYKVPLL